MADVFDGAASTEQRGSAAGPVARLAHRLFPKLAEQLARLAGGRANEAIAEGVTAYATKARALHPRFAQIARDERLAEKLQFKGLSQVRYRPYDLDGVAGSEVAVGYSPAGIVAIQFYKDDWQKADGFIASVSFEKGSPVYVELDGRRYLSVDGFWVRIAGQVRRTIAERFLLPGWQDFRAGNWYEAIARWRVGGQLTALVGDLPVDDQETPGVQMKRSARGAGIRRANADWDFTLDNYRVSHLLTTALELGWRRGGGAFEQLAEDAAARRDYRQALSLYQLAIRFADKLQKTLPKVRELEEMSGVYVQLGSYDRAIECLFQSLDLESTLGYAPQNQS